MCTYFQSACTVVHVWISLQIPRIFRLCIPALVNVILYNMLYVQAKRHKHTELGKVVYIVHMYTTVMVYDRGVHMDNGDGVHVTPLLGHYNLTHVHMVQQNHIVQNSFLVHLSYFECI